MISEIKSFHAANANVGYKVSDADMAKFLVYEEFEHIRNSHLVSKCVIDNERLLMIAARINNELGQN